MEVKKNGCFLKTQTDADHKSVVGEFSLPIRNVFFQDTHHSTPEQDFMILHADYKIAWSVAHAVAVFPVYTGVLHCLRHQPWRGSGHVETSTKA